MKSISPEQGPAAAYPGAAYGPQPCSLQELRERPRAAPAPVVAGALGPGFYLLAGSFKAGKTSAALQLSLQVCTGGEVWGRETHQGTVLFVTKEDSEASLYEKISYMDDGSVSEEFFSLTVKYIDTAQVKAFLRTRPDTILVVLDALTKREVKTASEWKELAGQYGVCILAVHHTKKAENEEILNELHGNTGPLAGADGVLTLQKDDDESRAVLSVTARDFPKQKLYLKRDERRLTWVLDGDGGPPPDPILTALARSVTPETPLWRGSATELADALGLDMAANKLSGKLKKDADKLLKDFNIQYRSTRSGNKRSITLAYIPPEEDGGDGDDKE